MPRTLTTTIVELNAVIIFVRKVIQKFSQVVIIFAESNGSNFVTFKKY